MKRFFTIMIIAQMISFLNLTPNMLAFAEENENVVTEEQDQLNLSLDYVLEKAYENNGNLKLLEFSNKIIDNQKEENGDKVAELRGPDDDDIDYSDCPEPPGDPTDPEYTKKMTAYQSCYFSNVMIKNVNKQQEEAIDEQKEDQLEALLDQAKSFKNDQDKNEIEIQQTKEAIRINIVNTYTNLLQMNEQKSILKSTLSKLENDEKIARVKYSLGMITYKDMKEVEKTRENTELQYQKLKNEYNALLKILTISIGIPFNPELNLQAINFGEVKEVELNQNIDLLIENSYGIKKLKNDLSLLKTLRAEEGDNFKSKDYKLKIEQTEKAIEKTENDLRQKINALYKDLNVAYLNYQEASKELSNLENVMFTIERQYRVGFVSKQTYEEVKLNVEKATFNVLSNKIQYYLNKEKKISLENGYIQ